MRREIRTWIENTTLILQINQTLTDPVRPLSSVQTTLQVGKRQVSLQILQKSLVIENYGVSLQHNNTTADHVLLYTLTRILQSHTCTMTENIITVTKTNVHVDFHFHHSKTSIPNHHLALRLLSNPFKKMFCTFSHLNIPPLI